MCKTRARKGITILIIILTITVLLCVEADRERSNKVKAENDLLMVQNEINKHYSKNSCIHLKSGENYLLAFLYNKDKEAFVQSNDGGLSIYLNNNKYIYLDGSDIKVGEGVSALITIEMAIKSVKNGYATLDVTNDSNYRLSKYTIHLKGTKNIKQLYRLISEEYARDMVQQLYGNDEDSRKGKLSFTVIMGDKEEFAGACEFEIDKTLYTVWYFDGYREMFSWELTDDWYTTELLDKDKWSYMINTLTLDIDIKTKKFASDSNLDVSESSDGEQSNESIVKDSNAMSIDFGNIEAVRIAYEEWSQLTKEEKLDIVHVTLHQIESNGYEVVDDFESMVSEVDNYYIAGDKEMNVATIVSIVGHALGTIK